jgi:RNA polymerase sigma factor (sigma-70 family)
VAVVVDGGFAASFERLVVAEHASVVRAARRVTGRADLAEDAAQEALLHALRQGSRVLAAREPGRVLRWLATRHACMELRSRRRIDGACEASDSLGAMAGRERGPERDDELRRVRAELARLPVELRDALTLRFDDGATYQSIAERLSISEATAHARVRRGLDALRRRLVPRRSALSALVLRWCSDAPFGRWLRAPSRLSPAAPTNPLSWGVVGVAASITIGLSVWWLATDRRASPLPAAESASVPARDVGRPPRPEASASSALELDALDPSTWGHRVPLSAYLDAGGTLPAVAPPSVAVEPARLLGRVLDPRGQRLAGAVVELEAAVPGVDLALSVARTTTDASGDFALSDVPGATPLVLRVRYANATIALRPIELVPGASTSMGTLTTDVAVDAVEQAFALLLDVRDEQGRPLPDVIVTLSRRHVDVANATALARDAAGRTDADGRILLDGRFLGRKRLELRVGSTTFVHDFTLETAGDHALTLSAPKSPSS